MPYLIDFRTAENEVDLASFIGIPRDFFKSVVSDDTGLKFYKKHLIPKRSDHRGGEYRVVWECLSETLADAHKSFARRFGEFVRNVDSRFPHPAAYGYVKGRGILNNAQLHCKAQLLLRSDLRDFFHSITSTWLERTFRNIGITLTAAKILARFSTIEDRLALGLHASPLLANLVSLPLDERLTKLATRYSCKYTRYADDLSFSGMCVPKIAELASDVEAEGFQLSGRKTRTTKIGQAHYVTGLSVSDSIPHVPRKIKRKIRQELFYCWRYGVLNHLGRISELSSRHGINRLDGWVQYIAGIEPRLKKKIRSQWNALLDRDQIAPSFAPIQSRPTRDINLLIDETEIDFRGSKYLALACVALEDTSRVAAEIETILKQEIKDPFSTVRKSKLKKKGIHFADVNENMRSKFVKELVTLPYRAYLAYETLGNDYESTYIELLGVLMQRRLLSYDRARVEIVCEENSKVRLTQIQQMIDQKFELLEATASRRPMARPKVWQGSKLDNPCLSIPDFLLAVFSNYATSNDEALELRSTPQARFEMLRDKYRLILNRDKGEGYSRVHPFLPW